jgi:tetratricopeptide (TPR) repeat protein
MNQSADPEAKRSVARLRRLGPMLEERLDDAAAALELLVAEAESGELRPELWERLHAAAVRDDTLMELGSAYEQLARGRRFRPLSPATQGEVLMHGADFFQGILGDADGAAAFLQRVLAAVPEHAEAFSRLERYFTASRQDRKLAELYAYVAGTRPDPPVLLIGRALMLIERLPPDQGLPLDGCERLVRAAGTNPRVITVLEAHCRSGGRFRDAAALLELSIQSSKLKPAELLEPRRRLIALYMTEAKAPEDAMPHVEEILRVDPAHAEARKTAERLLANPKVASRAAAALQEVRRRAPPKP